MSSQRLLQGTNMPVVRQAGVALPVVLVNWGAGFQLLLCSNLLVPGAVAPLVAPAPRAAVPHTGPAEHDPSWYVQQLQQDDE